MTSTIHLVESKDAPEKLSSLETNCLLSLSHT
jgi:hypothetical protein